MKCNKCGATVAPEQKFCNMCGSSIENVLNSNTPTNTYQNPNTSMYNQYQQPVPKKGNNGLIIAVVTIVALSLITITWLLTSNKTTNNNSNSNSSVPVTPVSSTTKVKYSGFVFEVPDDYLYEIDNNGFIITDDTTWAASIKVGSGSYDKLKMNKSRLKATVESHGLQSTEAMVKDYKGMELISVEVSSNGAVHIFAYGKASATKYFAIEAVARNNQADYAILDRIAPILKGAKYEGERQSMDTTGISDNTLIDVLNGIS